MSLLLFFFSFTSSTSCIICLCNCVDGFFEQVDLGFYEKVWGFS